MGEKASLPIRRTAKIDHPFLPKEKGVFFCAGINQWEGKYGEVRRSTEKYGEVRRSTDRYGETLPHYEINNGGSQISLCP